MNGRINSLPYSIPLINQYAARSVREDILNFMAKALPEFFKEDKHMEKILKKAEQLYSMREEIYTSNRCSDYDLPLFDIPIDSNKYD